MKDCKVLSASVKTKCIVAISKKYIEVLYLHQRGINGIKMGNNRSQRGASILAPIDSARLSNSQPQKQSTIRLRIPVRDGSLHYETPHFFRKFSKCNMLIFWQKIQRITRFLQNLPTLFIARWSNWSLNFRESLHYWLKANVSHNHPGFFFPAKIGWC